ncbi:MAG TPA: SusD/RagB family nutrient-binding outer membrane lipoprotein, partial [Balneolales bacterium]|nr:SusD/RagB family nutrient-binding outer membrane lipoprotein [Balneolales bacterium]
MNKLSNLLLIFLFAFTLVYSGCKEFTKGYSEDPNNPKDAPGQLIMPAAQVAQILFLEGETARLAGIWAGQFTGSDRQYASYQSYNVTAQDFDNMWFNVYPSVIKQARIIEGKADSLQNQKLLGLAQIMEAHTMGAITSLWGDVPYTEAADVQQFPNPTYDNQVDIYNALQQKLTTAMSNLNGSGSLNSNDDIFYNSDINKWIKAAHTLKARFYLHMKDYQNALNEAMQGIDSPDGSLIAQHGTSYLGSFNIYYSFLVYDRPSYMSATNSRLVNMMKANNFQRNSKTNEEGRFNYYFIDGANIYNTGTELNFFSNFDWGTGDGNDGKFGTETPFRLLTHEENLLIMAESQARLGQTSQALASLNQERAYMRSGGFASPKSKNYADPNQYAVQYDDYAASDF